MPAFDRGYWVEPAHVVLAGVGLSVLDIVAVAARFVARHRQQQKIKADDLLMIPALLFTIGIGICLVYGVSKQSLAYPFIIPPEAHGNGLLVSTPQISLEGQLQWAYTLLLPAAQGCVKASFLFFYQRIFAVDKRSGTNKLLWALIVFVGIWTLGFILVTLFECRLYFSALWTSPLVILANCIDTTRVQLALTVTDFILDVFILAIPVPLVWRLNLTLGRKIAVTAVFLLGAVTVAASLIRLIFTARILEVGFDPSVDAILLVTSFIYWGMVECGIAVFAACLPTLWFFFKGWSMTPLVRTWNSLLNTTSSSWRLLTFRTSRSTIRMDDSVDQSQMRKRSTSTRSGSASTKSNKSQERRHPDIETYPLKDVKIERV